MLTPPSTGMRAAIAAPNMAAQRPAHPAAALPLSECPSAAVAPTINMAGAQRGTETQTLARALSADHPGARAAAADDLPVEDVVVVRVLEVRELVHLPCQVQEQETLDPSQRPVAPPAHAHAHSGVQGSLEARAIFLNRDVRQKPR